MKEPTQLEQIGFWIDGYIAVLSCSVHRTQKEITDFYQVNSLFPKTSVYTKTKLFHLAIGHIEIGVEWQTTALC